jgi:hypothetical protein
VNPPHEDGAKVLHGLQSDYGDSSAKGESTSAEETSSPSRKSPAEQRKAQNNDQLQQALKNDTDHSLFTPEQKKLIEKHGLQYEHHNGDSIYLSAPAKQKGGTDAANSAYWYRTMNQDEFNKLKKTGEIPQTGAYGGIATNRDYANKYLTNNSDGTHTVEFHVPPNGRLKDLMDSEGKINIKPEGNGGTYGLGEKGTKPPTSGGSDLRNSRDIFNEYADPNFRVVDMKIKNPGTLFGTQKS